MSNRIRLVINAVPVAPGGGLSVLRGLLDAWIANYSLELDITVLASHPAVLKLLRSRFDDIDLRKIEQMSTFRYQLWECLILPDILRRSQTDILLTNNFYVFGVQCAQVVHHQQLWAVFSKPLRRYIRYGIKRVFQSLKARASLAWADANVFISRYLQDCAEKIVPSSKKRNVVIHNGLGVQYLSLATGKERTVQFEPTICAVQAPTPHKDNTTLLEAMTKLKLMAPAVDWRLLIAGGGNWSDWKSKAAEFGIADKVTFAGHLDQQVLIELFQKSLCLVYPSYFEGFGLPVLEAMACGCPVIATNSTAIPEIADNAAILVPPRSPCKIAKAILDIFKGEELRRSYVRSGKRRAIEFKWADSARAFMNVFHKIMSN